MKHRTRTVPEQHDDPKNLPEDDRTADPRVRFVHAVPADRQRCDQQVPRRAALHRSDGPDHIGLRMVMYMVDEAVYVNSLGLNNLFFTIHIG